MKISLSLLFYHLSLIIFGQQKVNVSVNYTNSYCGGARPTSEITQKYNTPHQLTNFKMTLVGQKNIAVTTDTEGSFSYPLKPGKYVIYLTREVNKNLVVNYDPSCEKMLRSTYGELTIKKHKYDYLVNLHFPCNPCQLKDKP